MHYVFAMRACGTETNFLYGVCGCAYVIHLCIYDTHIYAHMLVLMYLHINVYLYTHLNTHLNMCMCLFALRTCSAGTDALYCVRLCVHMIHICTHI